MATTRKTRPPTKKPAARGMRSTGFSRRPPAEPEIIEKDPNAPKLLRGMKDILPKDQKYWSHITRITETLAGHYGFSRLDPPILETTSLFTRSIGENTDVIEKEMFTFSDKGGDSVSLRPEVTAGLARAYIDHGMVNQPQPVKLWTLGPMFRYDRPQAGRQRQFHQFDFEIMGADHAVIDAQMILLAHTLLTDLGLSVTIQVNSLGDPETRKEYLKKLTTFFKGKKQDLTEEQRERAKTNPLRLLDSKDPKILELTADAPQLVDHLSEEAREHFMGVLEHLDAMDIPYELNPRLVRGLDYYTRTSFEIWDAQRDPTGQSALIGGGRYDRLLEELGSGRATPAIGFAGGIERIINALRANEVAVPELPTPQLFVAQLGEAARKKAMKLFEKLRTDGFNVSEALSKDSIKAQLSHANTLHVQYALVLGQKEILDDTVLIRDMESGIQETVSYEKISDEMRKRLKKPPTTTSVNISQSETPPPTND